MTRTRSGGLNKRSEVPPGIEESYEIEKILVHKWISLSDGDIEVLDPSNIAIVYLSYLGTLQSSLERIWSGR